VEEYISIHENADANSGRVARSKVLRATEKTAGIIFVIFIFDG